MCRHTRNTVQRKLRTNAWLIWFVFSKLLITVTMYVAQTIYSVREVIRFRRQIVRWIKQKHSKKYQFWKKIMEFWNIFFFAFNVTSSKPLTYRDKPLNDKFFERHCIKEKTRVAIYFWQKKTVEIRSWDAAHHGYCSIRKCALPFGYAACSFHANDV